MRFLLALSVGFVVSLAASAADTTVGAAVVNVTPPVGTPMAGYYSARGAEGTHDPLNAKAIVIEKDGVKVAMVALDLIGTTFGMVQESRKLIEEQSKIPGTHVMISATHSHTGPVLTDGRPRSEALGGNSKLASDYMKELPKKIAAAVQQADQNRKPAKITQGIGREDNLAFCRRFHMKDGSVGWNPGKKNPNIIRPTAPTDPSVPAVFFDTLDGKPIATYVNFAMHLDTVGGMQYSADYPYTISKSLGAVRGEETVTLFSLGCCGDINHINVDSSAPQKGYGEAARIGTRLAAEVLRTAEKVQPIADGPLRVSHEMLDLELAPVTSTEAEAAKQIITKIQNGDKPVPPFLAQVQAYKAADVADRIGKPLQVEVQVISLGSDLAFVSLPGEIFVQLGLSIKAGSPFKNTIVAELANGSIGYIPTRVAYGHGNYEVISARCAIGSGEKLVDSAVKQLREQFKK